MERLQSGKIYAADKVPWALEHFFKDGNLATLRELALREVAESLDRGDAPAARRRARRDGREPRAAARRPGDGLHVVVPHPGQRAPAPGLALRRPAQHRLVRRLRRDAARGAPPASTPRRSATCWPTPRARASSGAEVVHLKADDPGRALLDFARSHGVGQHHRGPLARPLVAAAARAACGRTVAPGRARRGASTSRSPSLASRHAEPATMTLRAKILLAQTPLAGALLLIAIMSARHQRGAGAQRRLDPAGQLPQRAGRRSR